SSGSACPSSFFVKKSLTATALAFSVSALTFSASARVLSLSALRSAARAAWRWSSLRLRSRTASRQFQVMPATPAASVTSKAAARGDQQGGGRAGQSRLAPGPLDRPLDRTRPPRQDRLAALEPLQVVGQSRRRVVAPLGVLVEALQADHLQVARQPRVVLRRR